MKSVDKITGERLNSRCNYKAAKSERGKKVYFQPYNYSSGYKNRILWDNSTEKVEKLLIYCFLSQPEENTNTKGLGALNKIL